MEEKRKESRMANMELLRMLAMLLVTTLHFLDKGGNLPKLSGDMPSYGYLAWAMESLAITAVNVYMLLSGYFLVESAFKPKRLLGLLGQIWFYSIGVGLVGAAFGYLPEGGMTLHYLLLLVFPVSMNHYWFMTAYVCMYLFAPLLSAGIKKMSRRQLQVVLGILLLVYSVVKSAVPASLDADMRGYDGIWYLCVFVAAAYLRLHGLPFFKNKRRGLLVYLGGAAGIFGFTFLLRFLFQKTGKLESVLTNCYNYNHILVLTASVGLFYLFCHVRIHGAGVSRLICRLSPYVLGVYLLQEHMAVRYEWQQWIYRFTGKPENAASLLGVTFIAVLLAFAAGICLDWLRSLLFAGAGRIFSRLPVCRRLAARAEAFVSGEAKEN